MEEFDEDGRRFLKTSGKDNWKKREAAKEKRDK